MKIIITDTNCNSANKNSVQLLALFIRIVKVDCHLLKIFDLASTVDKSMLVPAKKNCRYKQV